MHALILDQSFLPIKLVTWQKAMTLFLGGRAEVLEEYSDIIIRSSHQEFSLPKVLRVFARAQGYQSIKLTRQNIFLRDKYTCQYCRFNGKVNELTIDHVLARCRGGTTSWGNVVTCCIPCNNRKGDKLLKNFNYQLIAEPKTPRWSSSYYLKLQYRELMTTFENWLN